METKIKDLNSIYKYFIDGIYLWRFKKIIYTKERYYNKEHIRNKEGNVKYYENVQIYRYGKWRSTSYSPAFIRDIELTNSIDLFKAISGDIKELYNELKKKKK